MTGLVTRLLCIVQFLRKNPTREPEALRFYKPVLSLNFCVAWVASMYQLSLDLNTPTHVYLMKDPGRRENVD